MFNVAGILQLDASYAIDMKNKIKNANIAMKNCFNEECSKERIVIKEINKNLESWCLMLTSSNIARALNGFKLISSCFEKVCKE